MGQGRKERIIWYDEDMLKRGSTYILYEKQCKISLYGLQYEIPEAMAVIGGRYARNVLAQESALEDILQILPRLEDSQDIDDGEDHHSSRLPTPHASTQRLEDVAGV